MKEQQRSAPSNAQTPTSVRVFPFAVRGCASSMTYTMVIRAERPRRWPLIITPPRVKRRHVAEVVPQSREWQHGQVSLRWASGEHLGRDEARHTQVNQETRCTTSALPAASDEREDRDASRYLECPVSTCPPAATFRRRFPLCHEENPPDNTSCSLGERKVSMAGRNSPVREGRMEFW